MSALEKTDPQIINFSGRDRPKLPFQVEKAIIQIKQNRPTWGAPIKDYALSKVLDRQGIIAHPLSGYYQQAKNQIEQGNGLVLGFACSSRVELERCTSLLVEQVKISIDNSKAI